MPDTVPKADSLPGVLQRISEKYEYSYVRSTVDTVEPSLNILGYFIKLYF